MATVQEAMKATFRRFDTKGEGTIAAEKLAQILKSVSSSVLEEECGPQLLDASGLIRDGLVRYDEFIDWLMQAADETPADNQPKTHVANAVCQAAFAGDVGALRKLVEVQGKDCLTQEGYVECHAVVVGFVGVGRCAASSCQLKGSAEDPSIRRASPIHYAAFAGQADILKYLLGDGGLSKNFEGGLGIAASAIAAYHRLLPDGSMVDDNGIALALLHDEEEPLLPALRGREAPKYCVLFPEEGYQKAEQYLRELRSGATEGAYLRGASGFNKSVSTEEFVKALIQTKLTQIFAESMVKGDGSDWTLKELSIMGDCSIAVPVTIYDNGAHRNPTVHADPFQGTLVYTCGALLRPANMSADWAEIVLPDGTFSSENYSRAYTRRLTPCFEYINGKAARSGKKAFVTVPGLGCGQFAGPFQGELGEKFGIVLEGLLRQKGSLWKSIGVVYYDAFAEGVVSASIVEGIQYITQPLTKSGDLARSQLCPPAQYNGAAGTTTDFTDHEFFSIVAWDHVSWPGNDFWIGSRKTDDGVKAAATDTMFKITGVRGRYDEGRNQYMPPEGFDTWVDVAKGYKIQLDTSTMQRSPELC